MAEYIEREAARTLIKNYGKGAISDGQKTLDPVDDIVCLAKGVDLIPVADVAPVVHGKVLCNGNPICGPCSECGMSTNRSWTWCPNCGAKMDLED